MLRLLKSGFGSLGLLLAVRAAVGATPGSTSILIVRQVTLMLAVGLVMGFAIFWIGAQAIAASVYRLSSHGPETLVIAAGMLVPAPNASRTDPAAV